MRVWLVTPYPMRSASGVSVFLHGLATGLRTAGHFVEVIEPGPAYPPGLANALLSASVALRLLRDRRTVDLVHGQQLHPMILCVGLVARALSKPLVITVHGRSPRPPGLRGILFDFVEQACLRLPHRLVWVSDDLRQHFRTQGEVIPNGVPTELIRAVRSQRPSVRRAMGFTDREFVVAFVGRVTGDKGVPTLIDAFEALRVKAPEIRLVIVGPMDPGLETALLERSARSGGSLRLEGRQEDVFPFLSAADVLVLPSHHEGLPMSVLEGMAAGLVVISTPVGDVPRLIRDGITGFLIPPGDAPRLAAALDRVRSDPIMAQSIGERAAAFIAENYDLARVQNSYVALYKQVTDGSGTYESGGKAR